MWLTGGPDAGRSVELPLGGHLVGRAGTCALTIDDPTVEAHHALLEVSEHGVEIVQLAGRLPVRVSTTHLEIGDSRVDLRPPAAAIGIVLGVTICDPLTGGGGEPVIVAADSLAIVDDHPEFARARSVVRSLASQAEMLGLTIPAHVISAPGDPVLDDHPAVLEIGTRWRARWTLQGVSTRLHAAGMSQVFMNSEARRSAIFQPSSVRSKRSANSPTRYVTSGSPDRAPATISTVVVA
jgi:hypothetical protein